MSVHHLSEPNHPIKSTIGSDHDLTPRQLRAVRAWLGWTQREVAEEAQLSSQVILDWENGTRTPRRSTALALMLAMRRHVQLDDQGNLVLPP